MTQFLPTRFAPVFRDYLWGGHRLAEQLNKPAGSGIQAESWEVVDHDSAQSVVRGGPWDGRTLGDLMTRHGPEIVGESVWQRITRAEMPSTLRGRFPLLVKFLDAAQDLSVQVHPNDGQAALLAPPDLGKTEAWYVLDATPDARIYAGLRPGVDRGTFSDAIAAGTAADLLHSFHPRPGDCIFVPAGTLHAIGAGLLILEVQQASNTTWRVFDWNRVDSLGRRRELHVDQALQVADFISGPVSPARVSPGPVAGCEKLVSCEYFAIHRWRGGNGFPTSGDGQMRILTATHGECRITTAAGEAYDLILGDSILIPALCPPLEVEMQRGSEVLEITAS